MRQPLYTRLRPFLRRDLRARLVSALLSVAVLTGLTWLGISALSGIDSREAHELRVQLGMESATAVCGSGPYLSECNYDDHVQEKVDRDYYRRRAVRVAVLSDLERRITMAMGQLDDAERILGEMKVDEQTGEVRGDTVALRDALSEAVIDVAPASIDPASLRRERLLGTFERLEPRPVRRMPARDPSMKALVNGRDVDVKQDPSRAPGWVDRLDDGRRFTVRQPDMRAELLHQVRAERDTLSAVQTRVRQLLRRDD
ncbi:MAG: hypothetical protein KDK70_19830, partial [Myxococcales bacterium]|nr:hypothetical protein [Myxococcales bacterium]